jgi:hypothetical protein
MTIDFQTVTDAVIGLAIVAGIAIVSAVGIVTAAALAERDKARRHSSRSADRR